MAKFISHHLPHPEYVYFGDIKAQFIKGVFVTEDEAQIAYLRARDDIEEVIEEKVKVEVEEVIKEKEVKHKRKAKEKTEEPQEV